MIVVSFLFPWYIRTQLSFGLLCFPIARAEAVRRRPRHSIAHHHLSLALEKWRPLPNERKIYVDCCLFLLVFPWLRQGAEKGVPFCDCLAPLALLSLQLLQLRAPKKEGFFCCSSFLLSPASSWCARQNLFARRQSAPGGCSDARPKHLFRAESFGGWGVLSC